MTERNRKPSRKIPGLRVVPNAPPFLLGDDGSDAIAETHTTEASRIDRLVGAEIARLRCELGMTRQALGFALGVDGETIESFEAGRVRMGPKMLVDLAQVFQCEPSAFFRSISENEGAEAAKIRDPYKAANKNESDLNIVNDKLLDAIDNIYALILALGRIKGGEGLK